MRRRITGSIFIDGVDDEYWPWSDERIQATRTIDLHLDANQPLAQLEIKDVRWGGECRVEVRGTVRIVTANSIQVEAKAYYYE